MNMSERFNPDTSVEILQSNEQLHVNQTHERVNEQMSAELHKRHGRKIFHDPSHSLGDGETLDLTSVRGGVLQLSELLKESFPKSLKGKEDMLATVSKGMEAGAVAHDAIIEIDGVTPNGMIQRRRGWGEGGNERESFLMLRREFLRSYLGSEEELTPAEEEMAHTILTDKESADYDETYTRYMEAAERVVAGTEPDGMNFGYVIDTDKYFSEYSEKILECLKSPKWTPENPEYTCMMIDSTKADTSLEGLLGSTSDLGAVSNPEVFARTGNAEFWELQYGISKECAEFLKNPDSLPATRVSTIVHAMKGWRRTQVGVAFGQKIRLEEKYNSENIEALFEATFQTQPREEEVEDFIEGVKTAMSGAEQSIQVSADIYADFTERFSPLLDLPDGPLTEESKALFAEAIAYMNADEEMLSDYVAHVDEELEKQKV
jgi:hypothetical protein